MSFDALESSQASGQPVELYKFSRSGGIVTELEVFRQDFSDYANTAAFLAEWIEDTDGAATATMTWDLDATHVVAGETISAHVNVTGSATPGDAYKVVLTIPGFVPGRTYSFRRQAYATEIVAGLPANQFNSLASNVVADISGNLELVLRFTTPDGGTFDVDIWFGDVHVVDTTIGEATDVFYTSADATIAYDGDDYLPAIITRGVIDAGGQEIRDSNLELRLPSEHEVAGWFAITTDQRPVTVTMYRVHRTDLTDAITPDVTRVTKIRFEGKSCILTCATAGLRVLNRETPRQFFSIACNHVLYSDRCGVSKVARTLAATVVTNVSSDGLQVTVTGVDAYAVDRVVVGCFVSGVLAPHGRQPVTIVGQAGDVLTLIRPIPGLAVDDVVDVIEGCARSVAACNAHNNIENYGGFPGIPVRNPFDPTGRGIT
jgi:hypothetical protein